MYFPFSELRKWGKKAAETRRRNCVVLPYKFFCRLRVTFLCEAFEIWMGARKGRPFFA